jgi:hypothetical protein
MAPLDWKGDREAARKRFLESVFLAERRLPAEDLNFFAWRLLFQVDPRDVSGLQAELKASLEAERRQGRLQVVVSSKRLNKKPAGW